MSRARDLTHKARTAPAFNPPRRRSSPAFSSPVCLVLPPARCSRCGTMRASGELVQERAALVCKGGCR
jgi:hypothetical protein